MNAWSEIVRRRFDAFLEPRWRDAWPILAPQLQGALLEGRASENVDQLVPLVRGGRLEERYWTYGCSPVPGDDGSIGGVLVVALPFGRAYMQLAESLRKVVVEGRLGQADIDEAYRTLYGTLLRLACEAGTAQDFDGIRLQVRRWAVETGTGRGGARRGARAG